MKKRSRSQAEPLFRQMDAAVPGWFKALWITLNGLEGFTYRQDCNMANCLEDGFYGLNIMVNVTAAIVASYRSKIGLTSSVYKQGRKPAKAPQKPPTQDEVMEYGRWLKPAYPIPRHRVREKFIPHLEKKGIRDWKRCLRNWADGSHSRHTGM